MPKGTVESLLEPQNREKLAAILKYHVVAGRVATLEPADDDIVDIRIISGLNHGKVTVNPDNTFAVVLTLEAVPGTASNLVVPLPPSAIDSDEVEQLGAAFRRQLGPPGQRYWALLLGGDGAGYRYTQADWLCLAALLSSLARRHDIRWLLVSSRRTGRRAEALLKGHADAACVAHACWYRDRDEYRPEAWLGAAERVFVTEDSMTMLSEAACALRPVHSLRPATAAPAQRYEQALQRFAGQRWLCRHTIAELADRGITSGIGDGLYGPSLDVTRAQMAKFLVVALEGTKKLAPHRVVSILDY